MLKLGLIGFVFETLLYISFRKGFLDKRLYSSLVFTQISFIIMRMPVSIEKLNPAKPFLKWAGGKAQLLNEIDNQLPKKDILSDKINTYVEPFLGGGAVFFHIAQNYPSFKHFYLLDINQDLINCYNAVKKNVNQVIDELKNLEEQFLSGSKAERKNFYYEKRSEFNRDKDPAKLIFLNKTCFNGLYRVNKSNGFNVPFGKYKNPTICDEPKLQSVSQVLQNAEIVQGDFEDCFDYIDNKTFVYLDPPYRPLSPTAGFTSYSKKDFKEKEQMRLAEFCKWIDRKNAKFLLSNSDPKNEDPDDSFFEEHYKKFKIQRVKATRAINCKASGRGQINELIITNC